MWTIIVSVLLILCVLSAHICVAYSLRPFVATIAAKKTWQSRNIRTGLHCRQQEDVYHGAPTVILDGFFKEANGMSDLLVLQSVYAQSRDSRITVVTDNTSFARKRLVTPSTVYSGLLDNVQYEEVDSRCGDRYKHLVRSAEVLISYGITPSEIQSVVASVCASEHLKRAVLAVQVSSGEGTDTHGVASSEIDQAVSALQSQSKVKYTVFKYAGVATRKEGLRPYRVVRNGQPLPVGGPSPAPELLSSGDMFRVLAEVVDLPKTFNQVYGIGPGTGLDAEIVTYMKSRGWSERVQVGLLVGDMMEVIEKRVEEQNRRAKQPVSAGHKADLEPVVREGHDNKFAGFFT